MSTSPVLDLYRSAVARGAAPTNKELEDAFSAYADPHERSMYGKSRADVIAEFGFGLPTAEVITGIAQYGPVLEIGAGSGLWSFFLTKSGCDTIAVDLATNGYSLGLGIGRYHPVLRMDAIDAIRAYPRRSILLVWPDMMNDLSERVADALGIGQTLVHMGENGNGCTGTPGFRVRLKESFSTVGTAHPPVWRSLSDSLTIFRKERACAPDMQPTSTRHP